MTIFFLLVALKERMEWVDVFGGYAHFVLLKFHVYFFVVKVIQPSPVDHMLFYKSRHHRMLG